MGLPWQRRKGNERRGPHAIDTQGTTYYCCRRAAPTEGYEETWLVLSPESKIISITGVLLVNGMAESERLARRAYSISARR